MTALVVLGARLVRAGGVFRVVSLALGTAVAVTLLGLAWALPDALYPIVAPDEVDPQRGVLTTLLALVIAPVAALLLAVGRLSSSVRDRRIGSLHLLGVGRARLAVVAAVENLLPAAAGALVGIAGFLVVRPVLTDRLASVLQEPIVGGARLAVVAIAAVGVSVVLALTPLIRLGSPRAAVSEAPRQRPSLWRLAPVPVALGCFLAMFQTPPEHVTARTAVVLILGLTASGLAVALVTPLVSSWVSTLLARAGTMSTLMAGREIQAQPAPAGRRVTALGVTVFVVFAAAGYLGVFQSSPHLQYAVRAVEEGPQHVAVGPDGAEGAIDPALARELAATPGVLDVRPLYPVWAASCMEGDSPNCPQVFIGTCAQLTRAMQATGCREDEAAWIQRTNDSGHSMMTGTRVDALDLRIGDSEETFTVALPGEISHDVAASVQRVVWPPDAQVFIPAAVAETWGLPATSLEVEVDPADGAATRAAIDAIADQHEAWSSFPEMWDYRRVVSTRTTVWGVLAAAVTVALLTYTLTTIDRARATRRARARLVAVGVPARLLRTAQGIANAVPLLIAIGIGGGLGMVGISAYAHIAATDATIDPGVFAAMLATVLAGAVTISLATLPLTRTAVQAIDLRHE
ncbi:hypothetical protein [Cellulosimicrobium sp. NPDC057127]|uniref:hypothetical protein n=1 Tax=Cellulosimicrobium sp. NPDC057127 TaxID=3346026 RepID=UPI003636B220